MRKRNLPLSKVYRILEPGPVVLLTTSGRDRPNVMPMSWLTMMEFEPPLVGCVVSGRNHSYGRLLASRECVINVPTADVAETVVACGNVSGRTVDKFARFGLTPVASEKVKAPRVDECYANLECRVVDTRMANRYNFVVLEVVKAWIDPAVHDPRTLHHAGRGVFRIAGETIRLKSRAK